MWGRLGGGALGLASTFSSRSDGIKSKASDGDMSAVACNDRPCLECIICSFGIFTPRDMHHSVKSCVALVSQSSVVKLGNAASLDTRIETLGSRYCLMIALGGERRHVERVYAVFDSSTGAEKA